MSSERVVLVGCGFPQLGLIRAARELDLHVIGVDANPRAIGVSLCNEFHEVSTNDADRIAQLVRDTKAHGLTTCGSEVALAGTARAAEKLDLPFYADTATVDRCQAKDQMRAAYQKGNAPIPQFSVVSTASEMEAFAYAVGLPVVVKPSRGWGQRGVSKVEKTSEISDAFERAKAASQAGLVVVETFIDGREFSVNAYTLNGETTVYSVTERIITQYPDPPGITFAEWYTAGLERADEARAIEAAIAGVRALGIKRGPSYTQLRVGSRGPMIVETAHRLGGGLDPDVALLASGVSLFRKILGVALSRDDWERMGPEKERHGGAIGKFIIGKPGRVAAIHGLDAARAMPGVIGAEVYVEPGGTVHPLTDGSKRAGHVLAVGRDRDEANANAERAANTIRIETV
jgi:biotin carboxylase